ncbi:golgin subfamily A member 6-like protein 22 isoform X2 [Sphaeramia orbicularis]|nr:golgin subfamily A member 6-like protein 22 isoform X2 [Sphaeramia orbicularis]
MKSRTMEKDTNDMVEYLQHEVAAEEGKVQEFQEMLERQKEASDWVIEALKEEHRGEVEEVQKEIHEWTLDNETLASAYDQRMEELQAKLRSLEKRRLIQTEERKREAALLRFKQNWEKKEFLEKLEKKLEDELTVELSRGLVKKRNDHEKRLKVQNPLMDDNKVLSKEMDDLRREQSRTTSEVNQLMETLRSTTEENSVQEKEVQKMWRLYEKLWSEVTEPRITHEKKQRHLQAQIDALRFRLESVCGRLQKKKAQVSHVEAELQMDNSRYRRPCRKKTLPSPSDSEGDKNKPTFSPVHTTDELHTDSSGSEPGLNRVHRHDVDGLQPFTASMF